MKWKIIQLIKLPEKRIVKLAKDYRDVAENALDDGYNQALDAVGEVEITVNIEQIFDILRMEDWFCKSRIPTHDDVHKTAEKISANLPAILKGAKNEVRDNR